MNQATPTQWLIIGILGICALAMSLMFGLAGWGLRGTGGT